MTGVDIALPVYNEESILANSVATLRDFLATHLFCPWQVVVIDNGSTDRTSAIAEALSQQYPDVSYVHLEQKGRGRALRR